MLKNDDFQSSVFMDNKLMMKLENRVGLSLSVYIFSDVSEIYRIALSL